MIAYYSVIDFNFNVEFILRWGVMRLNAYLLCFAEFKTWPNHFEFSLANQLGK